MSRSITAIPTTYAGVNFRSRLEARYAAFFDIVGWRWEYEPLDLKGWIPDFRLTIPCKHSECYGSHVLLVEVKPHYSIDSFSGTPEYALAMKGYGADDLPCDAVALFGIDPSVSFWVMGHGAGGGEYDIESWNVDWVDAWRKAGNLVQWRRPEQPVMRHGKEQYPATRQQPICPSDGDERCTLCGKRGGGWLCDECYGDIKERRGGG